MKAWYHGGNVECADVGINLERSLWAYKSGLFLSEKCAIFLLEGKLNGLDNRERLVNVFLIGDDSTYIDS